MQNLKLGLLLVAILLCATVTRAFASAPAALGRRAMAQKSNPNQLRQRQQQEYTREHPGALGVRGGGAEGKRVSGKAEQLWNDYLGSLDRRPIATKAVTSVFISTLGDVISQVLNARSKGLPFVWDLQRTGIYVSVGVLMGAVAVHYWYDFLETKVANPAKVKGKWERVFRQLAVDQTVGCTVLNAGFYILHGIVTAAVTGNLFPFSAVLGATQAKLGREMWPMLINNWKLWPAANFINFSMVPPQLRVLFANFVAIFWSAYLSGSANR